MGRNSYWPLKYGATGGVAVDIDQRSLESARRNLKRFPRVQVMRASVYDLPFEDRFDLAFSIGVIHHLEHPVRALEVMVRAVKPGGRVLIWVYGRENNRWLIFVFDQLLPRIANYWPRETVERMMAEAGLEAVKLTWVNQMSWSAIGTRPISE